MWITALLVAPPVWEATSTVLSLPQEQLKVPIGRVLSHDKHVFFLKIHYSKAVTAAQHISFRLIVQQWKKETVNVSNYDVLIYTYFKILQNTDTNLILLLHNYNYIEQSDTLAIQFFSILNIVKWITVSLPQNYDMVTDVI